MTSHPFLGGQSRQISLDVRLMWPQHVSPTFPISAEIWSLWKSSFPYSNHSISPLTCPGLFLNLSLISSIKSKLISYMASSNIYWKLNASKIFWQMSFPNLNVWDNKFKYTQFYHIILHPLCCIVQALNGHAFIYTQNSMEIFCIN